MAMTEFERETCSRCGGSGEYSYNPRDEYVCFKCGGRCVTLTKKGKATAEFFSNSLFVLNSELKKGDYIWHDGFPYPPINEPAGWRKIDVITETSARFIGKNGAESSEPKLELSFGKYSSSVVSLGGKSKRYPQDEEGNSTKEAFRAMKRKAFDYQSTLTKQGKVAKKFKKLGGG